MGGVYGAQNNALSEFHPIEWGRRSWRCFPAFPEESTLSHAANQCNVGGYPTLARSHCQTRVRVRRLTEAWQHREQTTGNLARTQASFTPFSGQHGEMSLRLAQTDQSLEGCRHLTVAPGPTHLQPVWLPLGPVLFSLLSVEMPTARVAWHPATTTPLWGPPTPCGDS